MLQQLPEFYRGKKVFLTGHTGFKGSWLLYWLNKMQAEIKGYALAPENAFDLYNQIQGDSLCTSVIADINNSVKLEEEIVSFQPDIIFHLAAQPLVRLSYEIPEETFATNAMGTAHVLKALRSLSKPCTVILITTDKVYENKEWVYPYRETDRLGGLDPYSASKACAELVIHSYYNSFFHINRYKDHQKAIAVARAGNVIGGGDWAKDRIIPDIVRALENDNIISVRNPKAVRPWQHVLEPLGGYLLLAQKLSDDVYKYSGAWNFGPLAEDNLTVEDLVKKAIQVWGKGNYHTPSDNKALHEAGLLKLDISKAASELQWKPKWDAAKAITRTLEWYKSSKTAKASELIDKDIIAYSI